MLRKVLLLLLVAGLSLSFVGCMSKTVEEEEPQSVTETSGDEADGEDSDYDDDDDDYGDEIADDESEDGNEGEEISDAAEVEGDTDGFLEGDASKEPQDVAAEEPATEESGFTEDSADTLGGGNFEAENTAAQEQVSSDFESEAAPKKTYIPVKKVADVPFEKAGILVNAVYLARPGDNLDSVSQKIFGTPDKKNHLLKVNPNLARGVKVGDKVYYNSPQRPQDSSQMLTFYEDAGLTPEVYISKPGENIRSVSTNLLGDKHSWKEVWATNPGVESKWALAAGTKLRFWPDNNISAAAPQMAQNQNEMPPMDNNDPPPPEPSEDNEVVNGGQQMAQNDIPPPAPPEEEPMAAGTVEPPPPPPPVEPPPPPPPEPVAQEEAELPPPPPPQPARMARKKPVAAKTNALGLDDPDQMMALGAGAILILASIALFIIFRKKRAKKAVDFNTATQTQID